MDQANNTYYKLQEDHRKLSFKYDTLLASHAKLVEMIGEYADHHSDCAIIQYNQDCDCGYEQSLKEAAEVVK